MAKSKIKYNNPDRWSAEDKNIMRKTDDGTFVKLDDYKKLLTAYQSALIQLDRAGSHVKFYVKGQSKK